MTKTRAFLTKISGYAIFHAFALLSSFIISELYFFSTKGVDFPNYFLYIQYFLNDNTELLNNHGLFFYYMNLIMIYLRSSSLNSINEIIFFNTTIQTTNLLFYIVGTLGLFKLLKTYGYKKNTIYMSLSVLHFVPKIIEMRILLKPEILVFALLPWIIIGINNYFQFKDRKFLFLSLFPLSLLLTAKGSIAGMVILFLLLMYKSKVSKQNIKELLIFLIIFIIMCFALGFENYNSNEISFFEVSTTSNYDNVAEFSFVYNLNFWDFYFSPVLGSHNDSFLGITLLDTFGDYFLVNLKSKDNYFTYYQAEPFESFNRQHIELIFALMFYILIFKTLEKKSEINIYLISPFIGILILLMNSFGIPDKNFDPTKGDTLKVSYYGFFIGICLVFLLCEYLNKYKIFGNLISIMLIISCLFLLGFPKTNYSEINNNIDTKIQISLFCRPLSLVTMNSQQSDCGSIEVKSCEYNLYSNEAQNAIEEEIPDGFTKVYREDTLSGEIVPNNELSNFINEGGYSLTPVLKENELKYLNQNQTLSLEKGSSFINVSSINECKEMISQGYEPSNNIIFSFRKIPIINIFYGLMTVFFIFLSVKKRGDRIEIV